MEMEFGIRDQDGAEGQDRQKKEKFVMMVWFEVVLTTMMLQMDHCLIFCRTNFDCDNLERHLVSLGGGRKFHGKAEKVSPNLSPSEGLTACIVRAKKIPTRVLCWLGGDQWRRGGRTCKLSR
eukprot:757046-Hanusia_phi.AAC.4